MAVRTDVPAGRLAVAGGGVRPAKLHGPRVVALLHQAQVWQTADGRVIRIDAMTHAHRRAALRWLRAHADGLHRAEHTDLLLRPDVDPQRAAYRLALVEPAVWLDDTALVARLATLDVRVRWGIRRWLR